MVDSFFVGFHVLRSIGEDVNQHLKYVAFNTSKRLVRWRLLKHLRHMGQIDRSELALINELDILERLYANPCYTAELNRMTTSLMNQYYPEFPVEE